MRSESIAIAAVLVAFGGMAAGRLAAALPVQDAAPGVKEARAQEILNTTCTGCHDLATVTAQPRAAGQWAGILQQMIANGADLPNVDFEILDTYLEKHYTIPAPTDQAGQPGVNP